MVIIASCSPKNHWPQRTSAVFALAFTKGLGDSSRGSRVGEGGAEGLGCPKKYCRRTSSADWGFEKIGDYLIYMEVSWNWGTLKSSSLIGFSITNHLFSLSLHRHLPSILGCHYLWNRPIYDYNIFHSPWTHIYVVQSYQHISTHIIAYRCRFITCLQMDFHPNKYVNGHLKLWITCVWEVPIYFFLKFQQHSHHAKQGCWLGRFLQRHAKRILRETHAQFFPRFKNKLD